MKKILLFLLGCVFGLAAYGSISDFGYSKINSIGTVIIIEKPFVEQNGQKFPLAIQFKSSKLAPELIEMCRYFSRRFDIKAAGFSFDFTPSTASAVYSAETGQFEIDAELKTISSVDKLMCQIEGAPQSSLLGESNVISQGVVKYDNPKILYDGKELAVGLDGDTAGDFCRLLGFTKALAKKYTFMDVPAGETYLKIKPESRENVMFMDVLEVKGSSRKALLLETVTCSI